MDAFKDLLPKGKDVECFEDLATLTVAELKRILQRYKEKTGGIKADLVLRAYAIFCRAKKSEEQTDELPDESFLYCNENDFTYESLHQQTKHLPWSSDLRGTPVFIFLQLYEYLVIRTSKFKHVLLKSTSYKKLKAFQFFYEGFIRKVDVAKDAMFTYFDVRVKASMKKNLYKVMVKLSSVSGDVCAAACSCPAGIGLGGFGNCNHVGGILFALEDFNRRGLQEFPSPVSCTSRLSAWNVPNSSSLASFAAAPIEDVVIKKIKFGKDGARLNNPSYKSFDPRAPADKVLDEQKLEVLKLKLAKCVPNSAFFGFYQPPSSPAMDIATLSSNLQILSSNESIAFNECYDISSPSFKQMMEIHCKNLSLNSEEIDNIEKRTRGQSSNEQWKRERMYRITSSNFYLAAVNTIEPSSKLKAMFYKPFSTSATRHGNKYERHARELYTIFLKEKGINAHVSDVGLILSSSCLYLGASLDGIVTHKNEKWGLEIKCPFSKFNCTLKEAVLGKKFFLQNVGGNIKLKRQHPYYFQIQGQMFCSGLKTIDFVVWFGNSEPLFVETIWFDVDFVTSYMLPRLEFFYCRAVLPELFTKRIKQGLKLYLHGGWTNFH
ncbi:uncharacterized protein LOC135685107 [Rhopilema esculentum]|uniref:uncharacterized protein LOC135685107 n=1 Tax=Rhopilema esculentum TaxID=499914 RepID=UPI0031D6CCFA|eukprot:gene17460-9068_t